MDVLAQSAAASGWDVLLQAMNIVQTIALTYIAARWYRDGPAPPPLHTPPPVTHPVVVVPPAAPPPEPPTM
jgi:hypothetical protein